MRTLRVNYLKLSEIIFMHFTHNLLYAIILDYIIPANVNEII